MNPIIPVTWISFASELAYAGVVYLRMTDSNGHVHTSLISSKTKVAPIKRLTLTRLELCGANLLAKFVVRVKEALNLLMIYFYLSCWYLLFGGAVLIG